MWGSRRPPPTQASGAPPHTHGSTAQSRNKPPGSPTETSEFVAFLDRVTRTRATVRVQLAAEIQRAGREGSKGDWRAAA